MGKKNSAIVPGPLGGLPGSGRIPKALQFKNYPQAVKMLDEGVLPAIQVLIDGLSAMTFVYDKEGRRIDEVPDKWYRMNCAVQLLKKAIPDKKIKEITGPEGGPVEVNVSNKREVVFNILQVLESKSLEELRQEIEDGSFQLSESDRRAAIKTEARVGEEEGSEEERDRSGEETRSG